MKSTILGNGQGTMRPSVRGMLLAAYGVLLLTLLLGALRRDTPLAQALFPIAVIIGLGQYASG